MRPAKPIAYRRRMAAQPSTAEKGERAHPGTGRYQSIAQTPSQHQLCAAFEQRLEGLVRRLRASWLAGPALLWDDVYPLRHHVQSDPEGRLANTLTCGFLQFSQLLAGFEVLVSEVKETGVVTEHLLASLEQLLAKLRYSFRDQGDDRCPRVPAAW